MNRNFNLYDKDGNFIGSATENNYVPTGYVYVDDGRGEFDLDDLGGILFWCPVIDFFSWVLFAFIFFNIGSVSKAAWWICPFIVSTLYLIYCLYSGVKCFKVDKIKDHGLIFGDVIFILAILLCMAAQFLFIYMGIFVW